MTTANYDDDALSDAKSTVENFIDEIVATLVRGDDASDDLNNDYDNGDAYHHENHVDKWYSLREAVAVIEQLAEHEETDTGLWDGLDMKKAMAACAAYTYGNATYAHWRSLIEQINNDDELIELRADIAVVHESVDDELAVSRDAAGVSAWTPPFDRGVEIDRRKADIIAKITARVLAIVA